MRLRVVILENTASNLQRLTDIIKEVAPDAIIKGFTEGNAALAWCNENAFCVDVFIGNWWGTSEESKSPEGANVYHMVNWCRKPRRFLIADEPMFERWSYRDGADGFIQRPATKETLQKLFEKIRN